MPATDVEVVRDFYAAVNAWLESHWEDPDQPPDATPGFQAMFDLLTDDVEWDWLFSNDTFRGADELLGAIADYLETVSDWRIQVDELIEGSDGRVLSVIQILIRGKGSGTPVRQPAFSTITVRDGKVARIHDHTDPDSARAAAGLG